MGADSSFFRKDWQGLQDCTFINWPVYQGERTLNQVAQRIVDKHKIPDDCLVVGHSLGGMVSCEIAKLRRLKSVVLISSALKSDEVTRMAKLLHHLAPVIPLESVQKLLSQVDSETARMFGRSDPAFIRAAADAIFAWEGADETRAPIKRIHGLFDTVISMPRQADLTLTGGHLLPQTHPRDCVEFIRSLL